MSWAVFFFFWYCVLCLARCSFLYIYFVYCFTTIWVARCGLTYKTPSVDSMPIAVAIDPSIAVYIHTSMYTCRTCTLYTQDMDAKMFEHSHNGIAARLQRASYPKWHKQIIYFCWLYYKLRRVTLQHVSVCCCVLISVCDFLLTCPIFIYIHICM